MLIEIAISPLVSNLLPSLPAPAQMLQAAEDGLELFDR